VSERSPRNRRERRKRPPILFETIDYSVLAPESLIDHRFRSTCNGAPQETDGKSTPANREGDHLDRGRKETRPGWRGRSHQFAGGKKDHTFGQRMEAELIRHIPSDVECVCRLEHVRAETFSSDLAVQFNDAILASLNCECSSIQHLRSRELLFDLFRK